MNFGPTVNYFVPFIPYQLLTSLYGFFKNQTFIWHILSTPRVFFVIFIVKAKVMKRGTEADQRGSDSGG